MNAHRRQSRPEDVIQRAVFQHIRQRGVPRLVAFHVPNGGKRKPIEAAILKGLGVMAGIPDIIMIQGGRVFALELKADGGRPTENQLEAIARINEAGGFAVCVAGLDPAIACMEAWGLLRGVAT